MKLPMCVEKKGNERSPSQVAQFVAHGLTEGQKRLMNRKTGPKKDIITVKEREQQVLNSVLEVYRKNLEELIEEYQDIFLKNCEKGYLPKGKCSIRLRSNPTVNFPIDLHIDWVLLRRMS